MTTNPTGVRQRQLIDTSALTPARHPGATPIDGTGPDDNRR